MGPFFVHEPLEELVTLWQDFKEDIHSAADALYDSKREALLRSGKKKPLTTGRSGLLGEAALSQYVADAIISRPDLHIEDVEFKDTPEVSVRYQDRPLLSVTLSESPSLSHEFDGIIRVDGLLVVLESKITGHANHIWKRNSRGGIEGIGDYYESMQRTLFAASGEERFGFVYFLPCDTYKHAAFHGDGQFRRLIERYNVRAVPFAGTTEDFSREEKALSKRFLEARKAANAKKKENLKYR